MKITPLPNNFGAEITGIDLSDPSQEIKDAVYQAFLDYQVLVIRDQQMTPLQQVAFTEIFGELEWQENAIHAHPDHDKVLVLSNELRPDGTAVGVVDAGDFWHSDSSHHEIPVKITILQSVRNPKTGGDTEFCNMYAVYDALPEEVKRKIEGRFGVHHVSKALNPRVTISPSRPGAQDFYETQAKNRSEVLQPLVRTHEETGRQALYASPRFTLRIAGMDDAEGQPLLDQIFAHVTDRKRPHHYRHKYRDGDVVMWDNRCTLHRATGGYGLPDIRRMHRTTVIGEKSFYDPDYKPAV